MLRGFRRRAGRAARGLGRRLRGWPTGRLVATAPKPGEPGRRDEVELWGPALEGGEGGWPGAPQRKWLGGTFSADGRWLIGVPSDAEWVLRLCTRTGKIDRLGEAVLAGLPKGKFKWLRGVTVGEHVFCIPACAECVLKVHPESGAVEALGLGLWPKGVWLWHGAALARDGNIYAIPANASRVLKISPATGEVALIGPELGAGPGTNLGAKWYGGILARDGTVWGVPYNAGAALRIDPATQEVRTVGDLPEGGWKWHGGRLAADGAIIGAPSHAESILRIQPWDLKVELVGAGLKGNYKYGGAVTTPDAVWFIPSDTDHTLRYDVATRELTKFGPECADGARVNAGETKPTGAVPNQWQGGVLSHDGAHIYCVPCDARHVLRICTATGELRMIGGLPEGKHKWQGGYSRDGRTIWCLPESCDRVLKITCG